MAAMILFGIVNIGKSAVSHVHGYNACVPDLVDPTLLAMSGPG